MQPKTEKKHSSDEQDIYGTLFFTVLATSDSKAVDRLEGIYT